MQTIFWISFGVLWVIVAVQGFALLEVLRQVGQLRNQREAEQGNLFVRNPNLTGQRLPKVSGRRATDLLPADWDDFLSKDQGVLVLLSTSCITCRTVAEKLHRFAEAAEDTFSLVALIDGKIEEAQTFITSTGIDRRLVIIDEEGTTAKEIGVIWKPGVVSVRDHRIDQVGIINDVDQLNLLLLQVNQAKGEQAVTS